MLTGVTDGIFCCLLGAPPNAVGPLESVESSDGYTFVEVKPGRVLRVKHAGPAPAPTPPPPLSDAAPGDQSGLVRCQRRITVYRNGRLLVENLGRAPRADLLHGQNGSGEPPAALEVELAECGEGRAECRGLDLASGSGVLRMPTEMSGAESDRVPGGDAESRLMQRGGLWKRSQASPPAGRGSLDPPGCAQLTPEHPFSLIVL